jgi:hypothetical protein
MFKSEIVNRWIVLQQGENHSAIDEEPTNQNIRAKRPEREQTQRVVGKASHL